MCYGDLRQLYAATAKERDALKKELYKVKSERNALIQVIKTSIDACDYCAHNGMELPCNEMIPTPDCDECALEKAFCCNCHAGSYFEWCGLEKKSNVKA